MSRRRRNRSIVLIDLGSPSDESTGMITKGKIQRLKKMVDITRLEGQKEMILRKLWKKPQAAEEGVLRIKCTTSDKQSKSWSGSFKG
jgi:ABC-type xylose transport system substrate-binding protein